MKARATKNAGVKSTSSGWVLGIQAGDSQTYRDSQLDDYSGLPRSRFPHHSLTLSLRARVSSPLHKGTWGFGLWNDPFGFSLGFAGTPFRLPALPNAAWFFFASPPNHLSFRDDQPGQGFLAQTFRSPPFHPCLVPAGLSFPFSRKTSRRFLSRVISEDSCILAVDTTQYHSYTLEWRQEQVRWFVDHVLEFESPISPNPPLGLIIWIDNQFAAFPPSGQIASGLLDGPTSFLVIDDLQYTPHQ